MRGARGILLAMALGGAMATAATASVAGGTPVPVSIEFQSFAPSEIAVLPGQTVEWTNTSDRHHTVTANDGSFGSGDLLGGDRFSQSFGTTGSFPYHCTVHLGMAGTVRVSRVILDQLPAKSVPAGQPVEFTGRAADPAAQITIERLVASGFQPVATASPAADGRWSASVRATTTSDYRATVGSDSSQTRRLLVTNRKIHVRATARGLAVTVSPPDPGAVVVLQRNLRERFGWWSDRRTYLDYVSRAFFRLSAPATARVVLADRDGWTPVATSPVIRLK